MDPKIIVQLISQLELHVSQLREIQKVFLLKNQPLELTGISDSVLLLARVRDEINLMKSENNS